MSYDAGGGINQATSRIYNVIKKANTSTKLYTTKNSSSYVAFWFLLHYKPHLIIIHDFFDFIVTAAANYKIVNNNAKIIFLSLCNGKQLNGLELFDAILLPKGNQLNFSRNGHFAKSENFYYPLESNFKKKTDWRSRKNFVYIGRISPSKINIRIIQIFEKYGIFLEAFGPITDNDYFSYITSYQSFIYKGQIGHRRVPDVLNKYKYHILSSQTDCFSLTSLEAAACGSIPLFVSCRQKFPWAQDISFSFDIAEFENAIPMLLLTDLENYSSYISKNVIKTYNEENFLNIFKDIKL